MSNKKTCPVCDAHLSDIYEAFSRFEPCPNCGTSYDTIQAIKDVERKKIGLIAKKVSEETVNENERLARENAFLREKVTKMETGIWSLITDFDDLKDRLDKYQDQISNVREEIKKGIA